MAIPFTAPEVLVYEQVRILLASKRKPGMLEAYGEELGKLRRVSSHLTSDIGSFMGNPIALVAAALLTILFLVATILMTFGPAPGPAPDSSIPSANTVPSETGQAYTSERTDEMAFVPKLRPALPPAPGPEAAIPREPVNSMGAVEALRTTEPLGIAPADFSGHEYMVRVGSFRNPENAVRVATALSGSPDGVTTQALTGGLHTVMMGPFAGHVAAESVALEIQREMDLIPQVLRVHTQ